MQIVVVGLPRSGTSMVAEIVQTLGVEMNAEKNVDEHNERGYWEDYEMCKASERIIGGAGGTIWNPPSLPQINKIKYDLSEKIRERQEKNGDWGWKDPRLCLTLFKFIPFLYTPKVIWIRRREESVVQSLLSYPPSNLRSAEHAQLFVRYLTLCLHLQMRGLEPLKLQYETMLQNPQAAIEQITEYLGIASNDKATACIEARLNHHKE